MVCGMMAKELDAFLLAALKEDVPYQDRTTEALGCEEAVAAVLMAKEALVLCGLPAAFRVFELAGDCNCEAFVAEGKEIGAGTRIGKVFGPLPAILPAERTALNLLQHLSGIATLTLSAVREVSGVSADILDTRKTTPGLRNLEKYAVKTGGGLNHRMGLSDGILIKDNHIAAAGSIKEAVARVRRRSGALWRIEVEVQSIAEMREALSAGADLILLDNMSLEEMAEAVRTRPEGVKLEASGNMKPGRLKSVAETGVDFISVGALTHSARAVDISLDLARR